MNGWMFCNVRTSFLIAFQSYQDDRKVIMKSFMQRNPIYGEDFHLQRESNWAPLDQQASSLPAELPGPPKRKLLCDPGRGRGRGRGEMVLKGAIYSLGYSSSQLSCYISATG